MATADDGARPADEPAPPPAPGRPLADARSAAWLHALLDEFHGEECRRLLELMDSDPATPPGSGGARLYPTRPRRRPRVIRVSDTGAEPASARAIRLCVIAELERSPSYDDARRIAGMLADYTSDVFAAVNAIGVQLTIECETRADARHLAVDAVCRALLTLGEQPLGVYVVRA